MDDLPLKSEMLATLHYHPKWLEYGFVDETDLRNQFSKYMAGLDENLEHYRYESFHKSIAAPTIDDVKLYQYIELAQLDEDKTMAHAALAQLAKHTGLTDEQWASIKEHAAFKTIDLLPIIERTDLLRKLTSSDLTDELFERALSTGDREIQRQLLENGKIPRRYLIVLAERGSNSAIRNLAKEKAKHCN